MKRNALTLLICVPALMICIACNHGSPANPSPERTSAKRYHLKGKVVSIDKQAHMLNVDGEAIPGFMSAMTMPYNVKPESELDKLASGESITADVVLQGDSAWLENITVTGHGETQGKH